jgi:hypothetical protein
VKVVRRLAVTPFHPCAIRRMPMAAPTLEILQMFELASADRIICQFTYMSLAAGARLVQHLLRLSKERWTWHPIALPNWLAL